MKEEHGVLGLLYAMERSPSIISVKGDGDLKVPDRIRILFIVLVCSIALLTMPLGGCADSGDVSTRIVGTWLNSENGSTITFNDDGTYVEDYIPGTLFGLVSGTYVIQDTELKMVLGAGESEYSYDVSINRNSLTLTSPAGAQYSYTRQ